MWKNSLEQYEEAKNWKLSIQFLEQVIHENPNLIEAYIRIIYLLHHVLLEENGEDQGLDDSMLEKKLEHYFNTAQIKFIDNAEYLFFVGKIMHVAEWYFGKNTDAVAKLALSMQKKASEIEHSNILYKWSYLYSMSKPGTFTQQKATLAQQILYKSPYIIDWLKSKGLPGKYVLRSLQWCYEQYKAV